MIFALGFVRCPVSQLFENTINMVALTRCNFFGNVHILPLSGTILETSLEAFGITLGPLGPVWQDFVNQMCQGCAQGDPHGTQSCFFRFLMDFGVPAGASLESLFDTFCVLESQNADLHCNHIP